MLMYLVQVKSRTLELFITKKEKIQDGEIILF